MHLFDRLPGALRSLLVILALCLAARHALAQDAAPDARSLFEEGITAGESGAWQQAVEHFEQSLLLADRPATRVNLVHAYGALERPLDVARHALVFLALPPEPRRAEARREVEVALAQATRQLATLGTASLPPDSVVLVDDAAPVVRDERRVYLLPGLHRLEVRVPGGSPEVIELALEPGQSLLWPRLGQVVRSEQAPLGPPTAEPAAAAPEDASRTLPNAPVDVAPLTPSAPPRWRRRLALVTGTLGALAGLASIGTYALSVRREDEVRRADPYMNRRFFDTVDGFERASNTVAPLALGAGALVATALAVGPRTSRWGSRATGYTALGLGGALLATGLVLVVKSPRHIGRTQVDEPSRAAGTMVASLAAPLFSYGLSVVVTLGRDDPKNDVTLAGLP